MYKCQSANQKENFMRRKSTNGPGLILKGLMTVLLGLTLVTAAWAGGAAPDFKLPSVIDGKEYSLSQFRGKVVLLNFFTFFCGPCREEMPHLNQIYQENKGRACSAIIVRRSTPGTHSITI